LNLTFEHKLHYAKNAVGKLVNFMIEMGFDNSEIVESLKADSGFPKGLEPEKYALEMLRDGLKHGFIHEQPDIDLEIELDELGVIAFKNSDKFDREKRLFSPDYDVEKERKYQEYLSKVYHQNVDYDYF
ncbi:TPA: Replication initiation factor family protein, partial [Neisseria meningitidis]